MVSSRGTRSGFRPKYWGEIRPTNTQAHVRPTGALTVEIFGRVKGTKSELANTWALDLSS